ncbi:MAG: hypothetical protein FJ004_08595 [Chloroflexi bacterium]|nr:hypothetical protein [Chloroflexota bacterium]
MHIEFASVDHELGPADSAARLCFSRVRFLPAWLKEQLRRQGIWEDLVQETYCTAWEAWSKGLSELETDSFMARRVYAFLRDYGYRVCRHRYYKLDKALSYIALDEAHGEKIMETAMANPAPTLVRCGDRLGEEILALLQKSDGGLSKRDLYTRLCISPGELDWHCFPLIKKGLVIEVSRENIRGRPLTPLLVAAGQTLAMPKMVKTEQMERIRQAYFREGKGMKQIAREFHHDRKTVRRAIILGAPELASRR